MFRDEGVGVSIGAINVVFPALPWVFFFTSTWGCGGEGVFLASHMAQVRFSLAECRCISPIIATYRGAPLAFLSYILATAVRLVNMLYSMRASLSKFKFFVPKDGKIA